MLEKMQNIQYMMNNSITKYVFYITSALVSLEGSLMPLNQVTAVCESSGSYACQIQVSFQCKENDMYPDCYSGDGKASIVGAS